MSMSVNEALSLGARSRRCKQAFKKLSVQLRDSQYMDQVSPNAIDDQFGRFWSDHSVLREPRESTYDFISVWAGNIGAFQSEEFRSSLDYRLREASHIWSQIGRTLQFLDSSLAEGLLPLSTRRSLC